MTRALLCAACLAVLVGCASPDGRSGRSGTAVRASPAVYADCVTAAVVGLRWEPPSGSPAAHYRITRNGTLLEATSETYFADTTVAESSHYSYSVSTILASGAAAAEATAQINTPAASPNGDAPYCKSKHIEALSWDWAAGHTEPNGSDLWPVTWGQDGRIYTFFGDGGGFGGDNHRGRVSFGVAMMTGEPPPKPDSVSNVYGGYNSLHPSTLEGKAGTIIAVGSDFYTLGGVYNEAELRGISGHKSGAPQRIQLAYSKADAYSWQAAPWIFCSAGQTPKGAFCPIRFVNYGRGNAGAPDDCVYVLGIANSARYWDEDEGAEVVAERLGSEKQQTAASAQTSARTGPDPGATDKGATDTGAATYLARVSNSHVLQREAYRYFAGLDPHGRPIWSSDETQMRPIFTDRNTSRPGCRGQCNMASPLNEVVYDPGIQRYIGVAQGDSIGQTSFYDAPQPWGPWTTISYNNIDAKTGTGGWANLGTAGGGSLGVHVVNAWTSPDGLTLWLTYSSDGTAPPGASFPPEGTAMDSFNLVRVRLIPAATLGGARAAR
jgi:hypothetical protein